MRLRRARQRATPGAVPVLTVPVALKLYYFITFGSMGLYLPYFPTWVRARGFVGAEMGLLMAALPFCQLLSPAFVGLLADKFSLRGRMMALCGTFTALGISGLATLSLALSDIPFALAALFMLAFALLRAPVVGLADVLAMEIGHDYGRMRLWGSLGFMCMALSGGQLIDPTHPSTLPVSVAVLLWLSVFVSFFLPKTSSLPPRPALSDAREFLGQTAYRRLLVTMMLIFGNLSAYDLCATLRLRELGATGTQTGLFWSIATGAEVLLLIWAARFIERVGPGKMLTLACIVSAGRWVFLSQATDMGLILLLQPLHAFTFGLMWVSAMGTLKREVGDKGTATAQGLFSSAIALGATFGVTTWGPVYDAFGSERLFLAAAVIATISALSASRLIRLAGPRSLAV